MKLLLIQLVLLPNLSLPSTKLLLIQQKAYVSVKSAKEAMVEAMKKQFYAIYGKIHEDKVQAGCQLMLKSTYDKIVAALINYNKSDTKDDFMRNAKSRYMLKTNVRSDNLFCKIVK